MGITDRNISRSNLCLLHAFRIFVVMLVSCFKLPAQHGTNLLLKNAINREPIEGAIVSIQSLSQQINTTSISNAEGLVSVPFPPPYAYEIHHINFNAKSDTLTSSDQVIVFLEALDKYLNEVVITGQFEPQSAKNSVFNVTTIDAKTIKAQGALSLQDVLSNALNVRFNRDNATGVAGISLQGISGQNVKVLLDGVSMIGRSGVSNEIDLNQINIEDVQRIELIEGPMAVNYGSDALAGVINIISKKDIAGKLNLNLSLHEETVGKEFSFFSEGIHAPTIQIGYKPHDRWYAQLNTRINRFGGWRENDTGRYRSWYPKEQYFADGLIRYEANDVSIYYKISHLNEMLTNLGNVNNNNPLKDPFAIDEEYNAIRWMHQLQTSLALGKVKLNSVISYTDYQRDTRQFSKNMVTGEEKNTVNAEQDATFHRAFFFRNNAVDLFRTHWLNTQIGIEGSFETSGGTKLSNGDKHLTDLAFFTSAELKLIHDKLKIRPGFRVGYNSVFSTIPMPSLNLKYALNESTQLRIGYGRGFRVPSIRELFHEFVDSNHNIQGNEDLEPEYSHNVNGEFKKSFSNMPLQLSLGGFFNYIDNRITLFTNSGAHQVTTYTNLHKFKSTGATIKAAYSIARFHLSTGFSYTGRYQLLSETYSKVARGYLFSPELNTSVQYRWKAPEITLNLFYKYYGPTENYQITPGESTTESSAILAKTDGYQLLDFNISKDLGRHLSVTAGAKNILNVTTINSSQTDTAHGASETASIAYGRSYFLKINFQFTKLQNQ